MIRAPKTACVLTVLLAFAGRQANLSAADATARPFVHPGLLHGADDFERIGAHVVKGDEPWKSAFAALADEPHSSAAWRVRGPRARVIRDLRRWNGNTEMVADARAAYQNALMWAIVGDERHAEKAVEILNAWGRTLRSMGGHDVQLAAGLNGFLLVNAAEIMRWTYTEWNPEDVAEFELMLKTAVYTPIKDFATFANGNWDAACIKTMMAIGVFCDDRAMFDRAVEYFYHGAGNGRLTHYVINASGQCQESGRDQQHAQLGLGLLAEACEIGWRQGLDMYGAEDNRLLAGFEYVAKYNLGEDVPFEEHVDVTGKYRATRISPDGRGRLRPIFEMFWAHYHGRLGIDAPYTGQAAERVRPERCGPGADHPGFGTLMFYRGEAATK
jgi:hypothetical protein